MTQNGPERSEIVNLGSDASAEDIRAFRESWQSSVEDADPCGGVVGVALIWFSAGMLVAGAMLAISIT